MLDHAFIYLIVVLNILVQLVLIRSLGFPAGEKRGYYAFALATPVLVIVLMRVLVATGLVEAQVAGQSPFAQFLTAAAGILVIGAPWLATVGALFRRMRGNRPGAKPAGPGRAG
jgi:hypothetical protein